ncbi:unnamed protein product [Lymnaea stagnalis]|uniref:Uncharacterized protein n=1 Tax=Lymnaea stagnalis TaxID=6523 RepID=A0AAV2IJT2_LYMST
MELPFSEKIFFSIVRYMREICKKHVKFDDFASVSGFLCFDIDGKTQHRFVVSEVVDRTIGCEGNSSGLGALHWSHVKKLCNTRKEAKRNTRGVCGYSSPKLNDRCLEYREIHPVLRHGNTLSRKQSTMQKSLSGPVNHLQFSSARNKMNNRTFTRENFQINALKLKEVLSPVKTFSNSTVNISNTHDDLDEKCILNSGDFAQHQDIEDKDAETGVNNHNLNKLTKRNYSSQNLLLNESHGAKEHRSSTNLRKTHSKDLLPLEKIPCKSPDATPTQSCPPKLSKREDSDVSIGSTRPKYLVKHNDELLLPCPRLRTVITQDCITAPRQKHSELNINQDSSTAPRQNHSEHHINEGCEENTVVSSAHMSLLINSIITAISRPGVQTVTTEHAVSPLKEDFCKDMDNESMKSTNSHVTLSSSHTASLKHFFEAAVPVKEIPEPTKLEPSRKKSCESQQMSDSSSIAKKKSRVFKWMKIFKRDQLSNKCKDNYQHD